MQGVTNWDKEKKTFENKIKSLLFHVEELKSEKMTLQHKYDETFSKLTKSQNDLSTAKVKMEDYVFSSKTLQNILDKQINDKLKTGLGYHAIEPPFNNNDTIMTVSMTSFPETVQENSLIYPSASSRNTKSLILGPTVADFHQTNNTKIKKGHPVKIIEYDMSHEVSSLALVPFKKLISGGKLSAESQRLQQPETNAAPAKISMEKDTQVALVSLDEQQKTQTSFESLLKKDFASTSSQSFPVLQNVVQDILHSCFALGKKKKRRSRKKKSLDSNSNV